MAKIISIISGKGGTGKSTVAARLSKSIAEAGKRVLVIDLDIGLRCLDILLGIEDKVIFDIGDVLDRKCSIDLAVVSHGKIKNLSLLCSPNLVSKNFSIQDVITLIKELAQGYDYVIMDLPAGLGVGIIMAKELADLNIFVTLPEHVTLRDTRKICDTVFSTEDKPCLLVINRVSKKALQISGIRDLDEVMDMVGIPLLAVLPEDELINADTGIKRESKTSIMTAQIFKAMANRIMGEYVPIILNRI